jgi:hypothetical protein
MVVCDGVARPAGYVDPRSAPPGEHSPQILAGLLELQRQWAWLHGDGNGNSTLPSTQADSRSVLAAVGVVE